MGMQETRKNLKRLLTGAGFSLSLSQSLLIYLAVTCFLDLHKSLSLELSLSLCSCVCHVGVWRNIHRDSISMYSVHLFYLYASLFLFLYVMYSPLMRIYLTQSLSVRLSLSVSFLISRTCTPSISIHSIYLSIYVKCSFSLPYTGISSSCLPYA